MALLLLYVNDIIVAGTNAKGIYGLKVFLSQTFEMNNLGFTTYFSGPRSSLIRKGYSERGMFVHQQKCIMIWFI